MLNIRIKDHSTGLDLTIDQGSPALIELSSPIASAEAQGRITSAPTQFQLEWSDTLCSVERVDYADAEKACAALGEGWRLPTREELLSIVDLSRHEPAIDTARFPDTQSGAYWTSTPCAWASSYAWFVDFGDGGVSSYHRGDLSAFVRAVRSLPAGQ